MVKKWIRAHYLKIVGSIAFYPAIISICFLLLSWMMLQFDFSETGKEFKSQLKWLSLKDASTARSIISIIAGGIISLTVFSFSMVMIVLNQAASHMSNRVVNSMIENRFQQVVLGFYIGTIVYALFLLSTIRDINSGIYVPSISIYLLVALTILDIFFFIYFLDYVTQTVKYETVIKRVQMQTLEAMKTNFCPITANEPLSTRPSFYITANESGYFQSYNRANLLQIASDNELTLSFLHNQGTYLIAGTQFLEVFGTDSLPEELLKEIHQNIDFFNGQPINKNPEYGFRQLTEIAIKALSPGINDPATAVLSINALTNLFAYRLKNCLPAVIKDKNNETRIIVKFSNFDELFKECFYPIWDYGKTDRYIQASFHHMLTQLKNADSKKSNESLFNNMLLKVAKHSEDKTDRV